MRRRASRSRVEKRDVSLIQESTLQTREFFAFTHRSHPYTPSLSAGARFTPAPARWPPSARARVSPVSASRASRDAVSVARETRAARRAARHDRFDGEDMSSRSTPSPGTPAFAAAASRGRGPPGSRPRSSPPRRRPRWRSPRRRRSRKRARRRRTRGAISQKIRSVARATPRAHPRATRHSSPAGSTRLPRSTRRTTPTVPCGALSARAIPRRTYAARSATGSGRTTRRARCRCSTRASCGRRAPAETSCSSGNRLRGKRGRPLYTRYGVRIAPSKTLVQTRHRRSLAAIARTPQLFIPAGFPSSAAPRSPR